MIRIINTVQIDGPLESVFEVVTTTPCWPHWFPAPAEVSRVTGKLLAVGDQLRERIQIGGRWYEGTWTVVEHIRPYRVRLRLNTRLIHITFIFQPLGQTTELKHEVEFPEHCYPGAYPVALKKLMQAQSAQAMQKLKHVIETRLIIEKYSYGKAIQANDHRNRAN